MTITVRCYEGEANVAYGPVADGLRGALAQSACADRLEALPVHWLAEAARLLPELGVLCPGLPPPPPLDAPGGQSRFFEGLRQVLSAICQGATPNVLFFDDMHWADTASLDLLAYLVRRLAGQPLFILATWRSDEAPAVSRLRALVAEAQRAGLGTALMLKRLALADVLDIVRDLSAAGVDSARWHRRPIVPRDRRAAALLGRIPRGAGAERGKGETAKRGPCPAASLTCCKLGWMPWRTRRDRRSRPRR